MKSDKELRIGLSCRSYELLVPANNKYIAKKAIDAGADAVYIGYSRFGARIQAGNTIEDIIEVIDYAHKYRVKVYITINTILRDDELEKAQKLIWKLYQIHADGIIIQDMGLLELKLPPIKISASTQCHNNTIEKIKFLEDTGIQRVILPREISIKEIKEIKERTKIELECFIHGALCVSYSGQCYLSYAIGGRSANRGECAQPCRRKYTLKDANGEIIIKDKYILSLKDLNLSEYLEDLIKAGVTSFKIEGRLKNETYVVNTTAYYRKKLDEIIKNNNLKRSSEGDSEYDFEPDLNKTFNRGYTNYNITGNRKNTATINYSNSLGEYIGVVQSVKKDYFLLNSNILNNGDGICFFNENNEMTGTNINRTEKNIIYPANIKGIKEGVKIYRNYNKEFEESIMNGKIIRKLGIKIKMREVNTGYMFIMYDEENNYACRMMSRNYDEAKNKDKAKQTIEIQLSKTGSSEFKVIQTDIKIKKVPFIRVSEINEIRRELINQLQKIRKKNYKPPIRKNEIKETAYPYYELDYKANIHNKLAERFYQKRGSKISEKSLESGNNIKNKELMTTKYCIKKELGLCSRENGIKKYKEPYVLTDEFNKEYLVEFNCKDCIMGIVGV